MRLSDTQRQELLSVIQPVLLAGEALYLFGSRTDNSALGGDIDLYIVCQSAERVSLLRDLKARLLSAIKARLGEQKIDLLLFDVTVCSDDPFFQVISPQAIQLI